MRFFKICFPLIAIFFISCQKPFWDPNEDFDDTPPLENVLPHIFINVDGRNEILTKENYLNADIKIEGKGIYEDFSGRTGIRGRGNSTWQMPKKPYKLKLDSKASLFGLAPYKTWILLAEYLDGSLLYNSIPYKAGEMLGIPYTNTIIPVEVTINGYYQGAYAFTEHKQVAPGRIDLGEDGLLLELDAYYDEDWQFKSDKYNLPVMVKYPKRNHMTSSMFEDIKDEFEAFEKLIYEESFPNNEYLDYFDDISFINYLIVYQLTANREINHPKSVYINKLAGGKYRMGIIWDFDWGFGYDGDNSKHYDIETAYYPLFWENSSYPGTKFFTRIMEDEYMQALFQQRWHWFKTNKYPALREHVKQYKKIIENSYDKDQALWGNRSSTGDLNEDLEKILNWLDARVAFIDSYTSSL